MVVYNKASQLAEEFIHQETIEQILEQGKQDSQKPELVRAIIEKAGSFAGLTCLEAITLSYVEDEKLLGEMFDTAKQIKDHIYGQRIVMFAPIYVSDYCVNECAYCGYHASCSMERKQLTMEQLRKEVEVLEKMGHKRLALEAGEDPKHCPIEYILECIKTIYGEKTAAGAGGTGEIRRVNVNIAATTVENYRKLKEAGIGTYILFQETYHKPTYEKYHLKGPKRNYQYHTTAHDRAMEAGIDDVGIGALYGLYDWHFELAGTIFHKEHLEAVFGVGPHTISVPRIRPTAEAAENQYPYAVGDDDFKKLVAIIRMAVPYTGIILSTREEQHYRDAVIDLGVSQVSAGSATGVGGYADGSQPPQFEVADERSPLEVTKNLLRRGYIPSFCTACYGSGRTGDRFMSFAKTGQISNFCQANAILTLKEYSVGYGDEEFQQLTDALIAKEVEKIPNEKVREKTKEYLTRIEQGENNFKW